MIWMRGLPKSSLRFVPCPQNNPLPCYKSNLMAKNVGHWIHTPTKYIHTNRGRCTLGVRKQCMWRFFEGSLNVWYRFFFCAYQVVDRMSARHFLTGCVESTQQILLILLIRLLQCMSVSVDICPTWFGWHNKPTKYLAKYLCE